MINRFRKNPQLFVVLVAVIFSVIIVVINLFTNFVPDTVRTDELTQYTTATASIKTVNINTAGKAELITLPYIAETRASSIIAYRNKHGDFSEPHDIVKVYGIGEKTYEKIKDYITV